MSPDVDDVREIFNLGYSLTKISEFFFSDESNAEEKILTILGFEEKSDYEAALVMRSSRKEYIALWDKKVADWNDQEKKEKILELFNSLEKLGKIRTEVFPKWFEGKSGEAQEYYRTLADRIILRVLECKDWDDYHRKRRNLHARQRYQKKKEDGTLRDKTAMKAALERDGHKCVITGSEKGIQVHHIDGDRTNNRLDNLVTLSKKIHQTIHNGARAYAEDDSIYWNQRNPQYIMGLDRRMELMEKYVAYLKRVGYTDATIECISGYVLFDPRNHFNIRTRQKRVDGWYNIVVLHPTGHHGEPEAYVPWDEYDEGKCEHCPYEGEPPCGDFHPGPYCFSIPSDEDIDE